MRAAVRIAVIAAVEIVAILFRKPIKRIYQSTVQPVVMKGVPALMKRAAR